MKRGRPRKRWSDEVEEDLNVINGINRQAGNCKRPSGMKEHFTGSQGLQRKVMFEKKKYSKTTDKGLIYGRQNLVTTRGDRIKNFRYNAPRNTLKMEAVDSS